MPKARAPQTAHLRKIIRKATSRNARSKKRDEKKDETDRTPAIIRDSHAYHWHKVNNEHSPSFTSFQYEWAAVSCVNYEGAIEDDNNVNKLCEILNGLAKQFHTDGRIYCSFAATAAIHLVRSGRQDDINPGLWRHINRIETITDKEIETKHTK